MDVEPAVTRARAATVNVDVPTQRRRASPSPPAAGGGASGTTPTKARRPTVEARCAARGKPSRAYTVAAVLAGVLGLLAAAAPATAARLLLKSSAPAVADKHLSLARHAVAAVVEAAAHGAPPRGAPASPRLSPALVPPFDTIIRALGVAWATDGLLAWSLKNAANHSKLSMLTYRRIALGCAASAALTLACLPRLFVHLSWTGAAALTALAAVKLVAPVKTLRKDGIVHNFKLAMRGARVPPGAGAPHTPPTIQAWANAGRVQSLLYAAAAPAFLLTGLSYIFLPALTMRAVLGSATPAAARALWQALGGAVAGTLPMVALNLRSAARENRMTSLTHMLENLVLAGVGAAHVALLARDGEARLLGWAGYPAAMMWAAVGTLAAVGLPIVHAGEGAPVARREE